MKIQNPRTYVDKIPHLSPRVIMKVKNFSETEETLKKKILFKKVKEN